MTADRDLTYNSAQPRVGIPDRQAASFQEAAPTAQNIAVQTAPDGGRRRLRKQGYMGRLTALKPRIQTLQSRIAASPPATERIRGSALQKIRQRILTRDCGLCQCDECKRQGRARVATEVDHRIPLWEGGTETDGNRWSLNAECHALKTEAERKRRGQG